MTDIRAPLQAQVVQWLVQSGDVVSQGAVVVILEAMKMEHEVLAPCAGRVGELFASAGELVADGQLLSKVELLAQDGRAPEAENTLNIEVQTKSPGALRLDLQRVIDRHQRTLDTARPEAVGKRHALGMRTARENISALCDPGSFSEYGALAVAAQRSRRSEEDLIVGSYQIRSICAPSGWLCL